MGESTKLLGACYGAINNHILSATGLPADAHNKILLSVPVKVETSFRRREVHCAASGIVLVVVDGGTASKRMIRSEEEVMRASFLNTLLDNLRRSCERGRDGRETDNKAGESNHCSCSRIVWMSTR